MAILKIDEIDEIMEEIIFCRITLTQKMSAEEVACTSEEAYTQFMNMWHAWNENNDKKGESNTWKLPTESELNSIEQKFNDVNRKLVQVKAQIQMFVSEFDNNQNKQTSLFNDDDAIEQKVDAVDKIKVHFDQFKQQYEAINVKFSKFTFLNISSM